VSYEKNINLNEFYLMKKDINLNEFMT